MKKISLFFILILILVLGACNSNTEDATEGSADDGEAVSGSGAIDHGVKDKGVGFSMTGDSIEEVEGVPAEEKDEILAVFKTYINTFNEQDVDGYLATLSKKSERIDLVDEREKLKEVFEVSELTRETSDETIVKYSENEAHVFAKMKTSEKQISSGLKLDATGRQVTVFSKDDGEWKVASIHYVGDQEK